MLLMSLMKRVARNHGFRVLLHEKPFDGINGSGKHNNWSLTAAQGDGTTLLHAPGKTPEENLRFVTFIVETLMAVHRHNGLLKASIVSATNAHRLGGNEAPPAIISSFLGKQLTELLDHIELSDKEDLFNLKGKQGMEIDIPQIPDLIIDNRVWRSTSLRSPTSSSTILIATARLPLPSQVTVSSSVPLVLLPTAPQR